MPYVFTRQSEGSVQPGLKISIQEFRWPQISLEFLAHFRKRSPLPRIHGSIAKGEGGRFLPCFDYLHQSGCLVVLEAPDDQGLIPQTKPRSQRSRPI
jgi:hypothetical protein